MLAEAADAGSAAAALKIGSSFDPSEKGSLGKHPSDVATAFEARSSFDRAYDPEMAKLWYQRAKELGDPEAQLRLDKLIKNAR